MASIWIDGSYLDPKSMQNNCLLHVLGHYLICFGGSGQGILVHSAVQGLIAILQGFKWEVLRRITVLCGGEEILLWA